MRDLIFYNSEDGEIVKSLNRKLQAKVLHTSCEI
jgi:hypothetical protein